MSLRVVDHYPGINNEDIPRNPIITVRFNKGIEVASVDYNTFSVQESDSFSTVPGTTTVKYTRTGSGASLSGVPDTIQFTPSLNLQPNKTYDVYVYGTPGSVLALDGDKVEDTYSFRFKTSANVSQVPSNSVIPSNDKAEKPVLLHGLYDADQDSLLLEFDINLSGTFNTSGNIKLYTTQLGLGRTITTPLNGYIEDNTLVLNIGTTDANAIEALPHIQDRLKVYFDKDIVSDYLSGSKKNDSITVHNLTFSKTSTLSYIPVEEEVNTLKVIETYPKHATPNVSGINAVEVAFNLDVNVSGINIYDYVVVTSKDVLE